jgi:hypothetical protein
MLNDMMFNDQFQVVSTCKEFFQEKAGYHREKGQIHKEGDDIMDAMRYGAMMIRKYGVPFGGRRRSRLFKVKKSF